MDSNVSEKSSGITKKKMTGFTKFRKDWIEPIIIALILVFFIKTFFIQNFKIPSSSMEDTLLIGDHLRDFGSDQFSLTGFQTRSL